MKNTCVITIWITSILLALIDCLFSIFPRAIAALLPLVFVCLSFIVFRGFPTGYRIFHLIVNVQIAIYLVFLMLFFYKKLFAGPLFAREVAYSMFTPVVFFYLWFLLVFGVCYLPYKILRKRAS